MLSIYFLLFFESELYETGVDFLNLMTTEIIINNKYNNPLFYHESLFFFHF